MCRSRLPAHYGFETKKNVARTTFVAVLRCSTSLADGNPVNRALDILANHISIVRLRTAQARLVCAALVHHGGDE